MCQAHTESPQLCPTLCDPMDCSPPGSSVHGILQTRTLKWAAMPSCRGSSQPGLNLHLLSLLNWQVGSLPLAPPGKPYMRYCNPNYTDSLNPCRYPQCSCLENPMDRGAWRATVHGVTESRTQLRRLSMRLTHSKCFRNVSYDYGCCCRNADLFWLTFPTSGPFTMRLKAHISTSSFLSLLMAQRH